jgi:hypothetical protein
MLWLKRSTNGTVWREAFMVAPSDAAIAVLRSRVEGRSRKVDDSNREAYRELARAGIMYLVSGFVSGPEYLFRWTAEGWARRFELIGRAKEKSA